MAHTPDSLMVAKPIETLELLYAVTSFYHCSIIKVVVILFVLEL